MIPEYLLIMRTLHLGNNFLVYILPGLVWVYNMILVRSYIDGLPVALQEAAKLNGANDFQILYEVVMPLCTPVIATIALFYAVGQWNSFMDTYLYAKDLPTLQYKLYEIISQARMQVDTHTTSETVQAVTPMAIRCLRRGDREIKRIWDSRCLLRGRTQRHSHGLRQHRLCHAKRHLSRL